jgi:hypothetical protein
MSHFERSISLTSRGEGRPLPFSNHQTCCFTKGRQWQALWRAASNDVKPVKPPASVFNGMFLLPSAKPWVHSACEVYYDRKSPFE